MPSAAADLPVTSADSEAFDPEARDSDTSGISLCSSVFPSAAADTSDFCTSVYKAAPSVSCDTIPGGSILTNDPASSSNVVAPVMHHIRYAYLRGAFTQLLTAALNRISGAVITAVNTILIKNIDMILTASAAFETISVIICYSPSPSSSAVKLSISSFSSSASLSESDRPPRNAVMNEGSEPLKRLFTTYSDSAR